jgi:hypothetical protein
VTLTQVVDAIDKVVSEDGQSESEWFVQEDVYMLDRGSNNEEDDDRGNYHNGVDDLTIIHAYYDTVSRSAANTRSQLTAHRSFCQPHQPRSSI